MKNLNQYGKGRQSVILEMIEYCEKEINAIKKHGKSSNGYINATMTGQMTGYIRAKQKLTTKYNRLKEIE